MYCMPYTETEWCSIEDVITILFYCIQVRQPRTSTCQTHKAEALSFAGYLDYTVLRCYKEKTANENYFKTRHYKAPKTKSAGLKPKLILLTPFNQPLGNRGEERDYPLCSAVTRCQHLQLGEKRQRMRLRTKSWSLPITAHPHLPKVFQSSDLEFIPSYR